jgi:dTDP-4-amino-4,6-dideoxygalactose transaminase
MLKDGNIREDLMEYLTKNGIETNIHYPIPCHLQPATTKRIGLYDSLPKTEDITKRILSLPMYPSLEKSEIEYVCENLKFFLSESENDTACK